jgi:hypothetical protein
LNVSGGLGHSPKLHLLDLAMLTDNLQVAVILAWVMDDAGNKDIVGATAAYAAVLVVFVGTGSGVADSAENVSGW